MFHVYLCYDVLSVPCSLDITCLERVDLSLLYIVSSCVFVTFPCDVLVQVWYLIETNPDFCLPIYFVSFLANPLKYRVHTGKFE